MALTFYSKGLRRLTIDNLNAAIREKTRELEIKDAQMRDAVNRPSDDELDELLDSGRF